MLVFSDTKDHTYARELSVRGYHGVYGVVYYRGSHPPVFHAQQCLSDHLFWGTHFSSAAPLESAVASIVPIVRHLAIHCLRYKHLSHLIPSAFFRAVTMDTRNHAHYRLTHGRRGLTSSPVSNKSSIPHVPHLSLKTATPPKPSV